MSLTTSQLACLLDGIDWRNPQYSWQPQSAGLGIFRFTQAAICDSIVAMDMAISPFPDDVEALKALLSFALKKAGEAEQRVATVEAELANAQARASATEALIAHFKLQIAKLRREQYGPSGERIRRLLDQMELELADLEADASEDKLAGRRSLHKPPSVHGA